MTKIGDIYDNPNDSTAFQTVSIPKDKYDLMIADLNILTEENKILKQMMASMYSNLMTNDNIFNIIADTRHKLWELEAQGRFDE